MSESMTRLEEKSLEQEEPIAELRPGETTGLEALQAEVEDIAASFSVTDFKCAACGFAHGHDTDKHRMSDSFDISHEEAASIKGANPNCHCGLNYAAVHGEDHGITDAPSPSEAARQAPISEAAKSRIRNL